ncbi:CIR protein PIR protein [Plasmodium vinckei vinckei]|uniref:CIR protein PIR protein n=1 Tax=Plasmodium vinckei vinckei TaxID=54757 RepID=A0A449BNY0_PLAVN|nr:CIR protein PIR protein [Plasmodium vinckei vinckei]VEV55119.1 CIR protein PIR protein [Plasmodium vinckei vinckei]
MDENMCQIFNVFWEDFPDTLRDGNYKFNDNKICETYCYGNCDNDNCETDNDKIMAGWISLIKTIYNSDSIENDEPKNKNINEYITIWLIYTLNLKADNTISNLNETYDNYVNNCGGHSLVSTESKDYSDIINNLINNTKYLMNVNKDIISKFYNLLKSLCSMYNDINSNPSDCTKHNSKAKKFVNKYQELLDDNNINTKDSQHSQMLSTLSTDYDNFKKYCEKNCSSCSSISPLPTTKTTQNFARISEDTPSSSSIESKLIPALLIFAIPIFLGIAYKTIFKRKDKKNNEENE